MAFGGDAISVETAGPRDGDVLFEVTVRAVVGAVKLDRYGRHSPRTTAFMMIAEYGADGEFQFPNEDGSINHVTVSTEQPGDGPDPSSKDA